MKKKFIFMLICIILILTILCIPSVKNYPVNGKVDFSVVNNNYYLINNNKIHKDLVKITKKVENEALMRNYKRDKSYDNIRMDYDKADSTAFLIFSYYNEKGDKVSSNIHYKTNTNLEGNNPKKIYEILKRNNFVKEEYFHCTNYNMGYYKNPNPDNMQIIHNNDIFCIVYENQKMKGIHTYMDDGIEIKLRPRYKGTLAIYKDNLEFIINLDFTRQITAEDYQWILDAVFAQS